MAIVDVMVQRQDVTTEFRRVSVGCHKCEFAGEAASEVKGQRQELGSFDEPYIYSRTTVAVYGKAWVC